MRRAGRFELGSPKGGFGRWLAGAMGETGANDSTPSSVARVGRSGAA
jgi:hypothetical protein